MKPKSSTPRPVWVLPVASLGAGLALSLLALIPLLHEPRRSPPALPPTVATPAPPAQPAKPPPKPELATGGLPDAEVSNYRSEMDSLARQAKINEDSGRQMRDLGSPDRAVELLQQSSRMIAMSECLRNQMGRGVPFYQGKAICTAAEPAT